MRITTNINWIFFYYLNLFSSKKCCFVLTSFVTLKFQIHDVEFAESLDPVINEALPTLEALVKEGKVRFIGVTGYPLNVLKEAILRAPGRFDVSICGQAYEFTKLLYFIFDLTDRISLQPVLAYRS